MKRKLHSPGIRKAAHRPNAKRGQKSKLNIQKWKTGNRKLIVVRNSPIHGRGMYARRSIRKGTRLIEYVGERLSHAEADQRYNLKGKDGGHSFLFLVDKRTVIDAGVGGNEARFINHSCEPNCEIVIENRRVFIESLRAIKPGEELGYDYHFTREEKFDAEEFALYKCHCGAAKCRGTMLDVESLDY